LRREIQKYDAAAAELDAKLEESEKKARETEEAIVGRRMGYRNTR